MDFEAGCKLRVVPASLASQAGSLPLRSTVSATARKEFQLNLSFRDFDYSIVECPSSNLEALPSLEFELDSLVWRAVKRGQ